MPRARDSTHDLSIINQYHSFIKGPDLLHNLVAPSSTAIAIDFLEDGSKRRKFSFKTLHLLSDALAQNILISLEKLENASSVVPVLLPQCPELYVVILAILKAGKAFCPLSLDTPADRLDFILKDISADLLITDSGHGGNIQIPSNIMTLHVDHELFQRKQQHSSSRASYVHTNDLAYVLYTSGSTGMPKAVGVSHRAVTQSLLAHDRHIPHFTRFLQFAAPTFDVSIFEIFFPWYRERTLTSRTRARMLDNLAETIRTLDVDAAELTPTVVSNLLEGRSSVPSLKLLLTIGEMLTPDVIEEYGESDTKPGILWAMYGPTEAAIHCTLQPRLSASASTNIIGFPLDTVSAFIVSPISEGQSSQVFSILPVGEEGELAIGGPQVAERYLNRPELTAMSFLQHPNYGYVYRTGDRAKLRTDGMIECFGRIATGQVKWRGQRVELGEIEETIMKIGSCRAVTVMIIEEVVVAFCATGSREVLRAHVLQTCKQWLPTIMIPSEVIFMHTMPQLPSGKIDRSSLVTTYKQALHRNGSEMMTSNTVANHSVIDILQHCLRLKLAQDANLASAGLDSLRAIQIASRLRAKGYNLTALSVLSAITVDDLLRNIESTETMNGALQHSTLDYSGTLREEFPELQSRHTEIANIFPCTPLQEAMLAETVARPKAYCNWIEIEFSKLYTIKEIRTALQRLTQQNEILRSGFNPTTTRGGTFVQVVWNKLDESRICRVNEFCRLFSLGSYESMLWPLSVQVRTLSRTTQLLFQVHHALYDGWSFDLILQDLEDLLQGNNAIQRPQFRDVIQFYDEHRHEPRRVEEDYWANLLRDFPETPLPNYNGRVIDDTATRSFVGRSAVKLETLHEHSRELMISPQVYFQAAVAFVVSLYVGSSDVVIGNVTSGRMIPVTGIEDIIGPCISSVPFRLQFTNWATARDILQETQRLNRESLKHTSLPLRNIAKVANMRVGARPFDVLFVWQQSLYSASNLSNSASITGSADELEFKITLEFEPRSDHVSYRATFDPSTVSKDQIRYLFQQIDEVVQLFLERADCKTTDIATCFSPNLCSIANPKPRQYSIQHGLSHAIERWAMTTPDRMALVFSHRIDGVMRVKSTATYIALNRRANQLAHVLSDAGVRQGHLVAVIMQKSIDLYVAVLAISKLGAGYLPLVPDLPSERMKTILSDAQVALCISDASSTRLPQLTSATIIYPNEVNFSAYSDHNVNTPYDGANAAYAVFTSGSTGTPKGVLVTQENLMSNLDYLSTIYPYSTESKLLQSCSQAFDVSVFEIFFSWHTGICLCTATKDDLFADLEGAINHFGITHLSLTPTVAALIDPENVPQVEFLVTAGEAVTEVVRRKWAGRGLYQGYGPSETTNICTVRSSVSTSDLINNIGKPFDNTSAFVLDPMSNMVLPRGAVGELCFGGYQVFKGYLNQPDLTAEKIISHSTYGRIYRSGDLGLLLADDSILFTGRMDDQVKIRGQRVELGEISFAVLDQECVRDCTTLLLKLAQDSKKLVNFWVPAMAADPMFSTLNIKEFHSDTRTIFSSLSHRLPPYMVPSHLVPITQLPMTPQGKIDKRLLQRCFEHLTDGDLEYATQSYDSDTHTRMAIITPWELQTASILAGTLGLSKDSITRNTSFFSLGLDSVSAISFSNELRKAHVGDFSISTILKNSTVAQLAVAKEGLTSSEQKPTGSAIRVDKAIVPAEVSRIHDLFVERGMTPSKIMPCTPLQEAMLSSAHSACESLYSNVMVFTINGELSHLQECWATMFQRHEILHTSFIATDDPSHAFAQVVLNDTSIQWGSMDWSSTLYQYANEMVSTLLYESKPPVWLAIAKAEDSTKLLFCCHHAVYDGIAIQTLLKELQQIYYHHKIPPSISFEVYLQHMLSQDFSEADQFWTKFFKDFEPTSFPDLTGQSHKRAHISASKHQRLRLPLSQVRGACQSASVSLLSVIQASWAKLLHFYTGESDVCFGNVVSGRAFTEHDLEQLVAPCFNTVPARIKFDFHNENLALAHQAHAFNVDSSAFQLTPLRRIQNLALKDGGRLFDTLVILQQPSEPLDNTIWTLEEDRGDMDLPLVCEVSQSVAEDHLDLVLHYHHTILSEKEASIVAKTFDTILATIINRPHAPANDTIDLPPYLRAEYSSTFDALESNSNLLHSGFEQIVQTHPKRTALDFLYADGTRTTWSFQTLNYRANDIAHVLIDKGVKPDDIIPLHIAKSPLFYASVLGVLKAGAAFAPVHPDLPEERKRLMLENLKADLVLCTKENEVLGLVDNVSLLDVETLEHLSRDNPVINNLTESSLAYCLFTSGSTGVPKAVSMEHHAPVRTIGSSKSLVPWSDSSRLLQYAAITFDMCYYDCFLAWTFGFALCAAEQNLMLDELPGIINTLGVDLLDLTPSVANSLIRQEVPGVKWLYCIGEAMSPNIVEEWEGACVNSYGPTEAAFCTTMFPISKHIKTSVIGKPFPSTSFAVFSGGGDRPLPLLSTGELYIGGAQLARGYFGKPELTEEKFVTRCGQRYYRSGDIVRMLSDGNFEFIGRADDQVKIRGLRVELGEINVVLESSHPDIATATTHIQKKDAAAKEQLVAFLVPVETIGDEKRQDIRRHLRQVARNRLPSYMVPQFFLFIDRLPRSLAGKVDKKALADIFRHSSDIEVHSDDTSTKAAEHNWTTLERHIRDVFVRLSSSSLEDIFPRTTIYQLGLDSISAVQIATALRRQGHIVSAADVMQQLTCVDLAACIERKAKTQQAPTPQFDFEKFNATHRPYVVTYYNIVDKDVATIYPCTPLQTGMISQMLAKDGASYVNYIRLRLESNVDLDALKQAWAKTMLTHQILRTGFAHLHSKTHPFGMIEYTSDAVTLPWEIVLDKDTLEDSELWLAKLQRKVKAELDRPPWKIRVVIDTGTTYLDIAIFHALFDAQSLQTIFQDVIAAYKGHDLKTRPNVDSVIDGILERSSDNNEERKKFWVQMGEQNSPYRFPNLAPLRYEPEKPVICTSRSYKSLPDIEEACRQANTTVQAVGLAGWLSLISAYTGEPTAACGVVLSGRTFEAAEDAVFPCINTVPFAQNVSADSNKMLGAVTAVIAEVQQHQYTPLKDIQRLMGHPNEAVFDTIFAYQKLPTSRDTKDIWSVVEERATIEYPISIELEPRGNHLEFRLTTMPHTIPREQAVLMLEQLDHLMQCFIFPKEDSKIFDTSLYSVTPAMEPTLPSSARLLHDFVEFTALEHPQRIALEFARSIEKDRYSSQHWTYSEIDEEGNKVAHLLISSGMQPGNLVGVCFDKCPEASFAMLGILKAGCAFVAIDPGAPAARQCFVVQDSGAKAVLSMATQSKSFIDGVRVPVLNLDETDVSSLLTTKPVLEREISQQDRSYCLYTSGTTGTPKGCELTHENAVQALLAFQGLFAGHWNSESRWLQFASFHFDVSVLEQYWSWSVGICVVSAPRDVIFEDLANSISTLGITHIDLTPSLAQILHPDDVPSLCRGVFITGGESLKQEILDVWGPKGVIYNGYGPTEATIGCTMYPRVPTNGKPSNIGRQFDNVGTFVLQPSTDIPVLRGGIGELCVSGKLVGKGYLNRDDLTKRSFPYLERYKERVYRTGDLVRILHNGTFEFLGRADDQVKLRGQRLEIGEINSVIRQSGKTISDVATLVLKHPRQQKAQLVAFVVQSRANGSSEVLLGDASETSRAREVCQEKLPPYMVPTHFIPITFLPLNINNKADSKKLREIYESISTTDLQKLSINSDANDQSLSMQEAELRTVIKDELDTSEETVGKDTSFFELGMDSISVIGVARALKQSGFPSAKASLIMTHSTIRRLAKALSAGVHTNDHASLLAAQQAISAMRHRHRAPVARAMSVELSEIEALAPCTPLQEGMIARYLDGEEGLYFNTFVFELSDRVDYDNLQKSWQTVYAATQILRTVYTETEDGYVQAVLRNPNLPWHVEHATKGEAMSNCLEKLRKNWLQRNGNAFIRPFELIFLTSPGQQLLVVHIFHGLYDGLSIELIFDAVWDVYNGHELNSNNAPSFHEALPHGPLRTIEGAKSFWLEHLSSNATGSPPLLTYESTSTFVKITRQLHTPVAFESTRRKLNVTAQAIAQACWLGALQEQLKTTTTVGLVVSGRSIDLEGAERITGPMFNTIPYRHRPQRSESWTSIMKRVHEFNVAAHPYQHTPLRDIAKWCKTNHSQPLFDSLFVYQKMQDEKQWKNNEVWKIVDGDATVDYPLAFEIEQRTNESWGLTLMTQDHMLDRLMPNKLLDRFEVMLHQATSDSSATFETIVEVKDVAENGEMRVATNGVDSKTAYNWTDNALILRETLADLTRTGLDEVDESTSIFELGLDSIDAIKVSAKLKRRGIHLSVSGIMRGLTIAKMLPHVSSSDITQQDDVPIDTDFIQRKHELEDYINRQNDKTCQIEDILPLTPLQEAMIAEMITSEFTKYYNFDVMKLGQNTNIDTLRNAWTQVVEASPILRTSFVEIDDPNIDSSYAQLVHIQPHDFWTQMTLANEPDFSALFRRLRVEAIQASSAEPPFRIVLVEASGQVYLVLCISHALYDGWSLGLLHSDVGRAYLGQLESRPSYQDTLASILSTAGTDAATFWGDYLLEAKPSTFIRRLSTTKNVPQAVHRLEKRSELIMKKITHFAKKSNVSLQTLGQSVFAIVVASYVRSLDVSFGSVLSGRDDETTPHLLFPTMNTVAIRTILHGTRIELLRHVQDSFSNVKQWQHFPLRKALGLAGARGGLFESLFIYQKSVSSSKNDDQKLYTSIEGYSDVEYPVCVEMEVIDGKLVWRCAVKDEVFDSAGAEELLARLDRVLSEILQRPDQPVINFSSQGISVCELPPFKNENAEDVACSNTDLMKGQNEESEHQRRTVRTIRQVLAAVSGIAEDNITDDMTIFHIGLDSISAIKVSSLLRRKDIVLSVGEMLKAGTVHGMARIVDLRVTQSSNGVEDHSSTIESVLLDLDHVDIIRRANDEGLDIDDISEAQMLPATAGQLYMISMWLRTNGSNFYPEFTYRLSGDLPFETLQNAWRMLLAANPILRTYLLATQDKQIPYVQLIHRSGKQHETIIDVTGRTEEEVNQIVNLNKISQPWARLYIAQSKIGWDLRLKIHHALYDGVSLPILIRQFQGLCNGDTQAPPNDVLAKFVASSVGPSVLKSRRSFWQEYLDGVRQSLVTQSRSSVAKKTEIFTRSLISTKVLEGTARRNGVSIHALFLAVYAELYAALTRSPRTQDVVIGVYLANRSLSITDIESAAVPTVNLVPLRVCRSIQNVLRATARQIQVDLQRIGESAHASASLWEIAEHTAVKIDTFVNFLTLPDAQGKEEGQGKEGVQIAQTSQWEEDVNHVVDSSSKLQPEDQQHAERLSCAEVNGSYLHCIDIEATVRNGALDVGIFAPEEMLSLSDGNKLLADLRTALEEVD